MSNIKKYPAIDADSVNKVLNSAEFDKLISQSLDSSFVANEGQIVDGIVESIDKKTGIMCVDAGLKSECFMPITEFFLVGEKEALKEGDTVEVMLSKLDNKQGNVGLSRALAIKERTWDDIVKAFEEGTTITGICCSNVRGGGSVDVNGNCGFLPGGQVSSRPTTSMAEVMGQSLPYKVLNVDKKSRSFILSRRAVLEHATGGEKEAFLNTVKEGDVLEGTIKNTVGYGSFVEVAPGVDGLIHVMDMCWSKINHPSELVKVGQVVKVVVIKVDKEAGRVSLGMKQLQENPWNSLKDKYKPGTVVKGKITNITPYGAFVGLDNGSIEGLLHVSELSWTNDAYKIHKGMQIGGELQVVVTEIDIDRHRIALSVKRLQENPWDVFFATHEIGQTIEGTVRNIVQFGMFVAIGDSGIDGLVHSSDVSWDKNPTTELARYQPGDKVMVQYLGKGESGGQRARFGLKQLMDDPFGQYSGVINKGDSLTCEVVGIGNDGVDVLVHDTLRSFIKKQNLSREKEQQRPDRFSIGDKITAKVVQYSKEERRLVLSVRAQEESEYDSVLEQYASLDTSSTMANVLGSLTEDGTEGE